MGLSNRNYGFTFVVQPRFHKSWDTERREIKNRAMIRKSFRRHIKLNIVKRHQMLKLRNFTIFEKCQLILYLMPETNFLASCVCGTLKPPSTALSIASWVFLPQMLDSYFATDTRPKMICSRIFNSGGIKIWNRASKSLLVWGLRSATAAISFFHFCFM